MLEKSETLRLVSLQMLLAAIIFLVPSTAAAQTDEDDDFISPVRPTVSESATIQKKGVLQIEYGGDFDFSAPDFRNGQAGQLGVYFAVNKRLRLDFELETVVSREDNRTRRRETGIGDINLGFKAIARDRPQERLGVAFSYSLKLPAASAEKELGTGKIDHNLRLIFNRTYDKNDFVVNFSYLNVGREMSEKRDSGAQIVFTFERELTKKFGIIGEVFGNTVDEQQPRGIYLNGALTYKINKRLRFDAGVRPGFGSAAPRIGVFGGLVFGSGFHK